MNTADKEQVDKQRYVVTLIGISSLTTSKVILFCVGMSELEENKFGLYLNSSRITGVPQLLRLSEISLLTSSRPLA
jgi:hypothetical protein